MLSSLSDLARSGIKTACDELDLPELYEASCHDSQSCAWLFFCLRAVVDIQRWFPRGKWATLQALEQSLDSAGDREMRERLPNMKGKTNAR
jgi:hypothetical protein